MLGGQWHSSDTDCVPAVVHLRGADIRLHNAEQPEAPHPLVHSRLLGGESRHLLCMYLHPSYSTVAAAILAP